LYFLGLYCTSMLSNPRAGGLPSGPRSRSTGPSRQQNARRSEERYADIPIPSSSRHVRQQKSIASFPREPTRSRPPPSSPPALSDSGRNWQRRHAPQSQSSYDSAPELSRSRASQESSASSVSSLFDRVRNGATSYASSFTSLEDSGNDTEERQGRSLRKQRIVSPEPSSPERDFDTKRTDTGTGDGYTVWSRVATAASTLTISVGKAWASNIATYAGEETPVGQESRLTRAMKAYHVEKARDPSDLPAWLFEEHERQPRRAGRTGRPQVSAEVDALPAATPSRGRRARAFPESSTTSASARTERSVMRGTESAEPSGQAPKAQAIDRLKALREARRPQVDTAPNTRALSREQPASTYEEPRQRAPKVGLPSGPGPASRTRRR